MQPSIIGKRRKMKRIVIEDTAGVGSGGTKSYSITPESGKVFVVKMLFLEAQSTGGAGTQSFYVTQFSASWQGSILGIENIGAVRFRGNQLDLGGYVEGYPDDINVICENVLSTVVSAELPLTVNYINNSGAGNFLRRVNLLVEEVDGS